MIENIPPPETFLSNSAEFLYESFNILITLNNELDPFIFFNEEHGFDSEEFSSENKIRIGNISLLIFTSIENYLKYKISLESPLLLISRLSNLQWKKMNFNDFYMHSFEDLLKLYSVIYSTTENNKLKIGFEKLRKTRNLFVHGSGDDSTVLKELIEVVSFFIEEIWNKNLQDKRSPIFKFFSEFSGALDDYHDTLSFIPELEDENEAHLKLLKIYRLLQCFLSESELLAFIGLNRDDIKVDCPACSIYSYQFDNFNIKTAINIKDEDGEDKLKCYLCYLETTTED
ncbi:hypothetical protein B9T24_13995 [Acinetobacter sp. ANC 4654]|uniref:hypothetical protein n=1 Tax=Acinetobacter sp. ANC 4654 TaxID=1977872 RepID=UPI000A35B841|nr:hypothetical protein [Acinetobacter sp. ANC 4654]OTG93579.1 hypothetical protein B9T24_13995 [Acinetobacter sp. ANC 4654]